MGVCEAMVTKNFPQGGTMGLIPHVTVLPLHHIVYSLFIVYWVLVGNWVKGECW